MWSDIKNGMIIASILGPIPFIAIFDLPRWLLAIYLGWLCLIFIVNAPFCFGKPKKKKGKKFITFRIDEDKEKSA